MRYFLSLMLLSTFFSSATFSQLPNGDFENWAMNGFNILDPVGWNTFNYGLATASQYQPAQTGTYGLKLTNDTIAGNFLPGMITCYFHNSQSPASIDGYYFGHFAAGDIFTFSVSFYDASMNVVANGFYSSTNDQTNYTPFSVPITYSSSAMPDTAIISITLDYGSQNNLSGFVVIDGLTFSNSNGIKNINDQTDVKAWPDPSNDVIHLDFVSRSNTADNIYVTDLRGRIISATISNSIQTNDHHQIIINTSSMEPGMYFLRIHSEEKMISKSFVVAR